MGQKSETEAADVMNSDWHTAYIGIGSNIGDKLLNCKTAIDELTKTGQTVLVSQSRFYMTEPVDYTDQEWFVNAAVEIKTTLNPIELLKTLKNIEINAGRAQNPIRFGPRILDMDIILYDNLMLSSPILTIPHPRMHQRRFVLQPMCDINPSVVHPIFRQDMQNLLNRLTDNGQTIREYDD